MDPISFTRRSETGSAVFVLLPYVSRPEGFPKAVVIRTPALALEPGSGLPSASERQVFDDIENAFSPVLEEAGALQVARRMSGEEKIWLSYVQAESNTVDEIRAVLSASHTSRTVSVTEMADPDWALFYQEFFPTDDELEQALDRQVLFAMRESGADLSEPRHLRQFATFPNKEAARPFRQRIEDEGLRVFFSGEGEAGGWKVHFDSQAVLGDPALLPWLAKCREWVREFGGSHDGWDAETRQATKTGAQPPAQQMMGPAVISTSIPPPEHSSSAAMLKQRMAAQPINSSAHTHGLAIASFILALIGPLFCGVLSPLAIIFAHKSRNAIRRSGGKLKGGGLAAAGMVIGYITLAVAFLVGGVLALAHFTSPRGSHAKRHGNYNVARSAHQTVLTRKEQVGIPSEPPPSAVLRLVKYPSPAGQLDAYVSPDPGDGSRRPAVIWLVGGFSNSISDVWSPQPVDNDQSASVFRESGLLMMYPSLRGGNENPGYKEAFLGEVDDVLAALKWLSSQPYVDPQRIYLGGHSTGGTLALLAAAASPDWRAVFAFGPVDEVASYGQDMLPYNAQDAAENDIRDPINWLHNIQSPTFVIEGTREANLTSLRALRLENTNLKVQFFEVADETHFTIIRPVSTLVASLIQADKGLNPSISLTSEALNQSMKKASR